MAQLSHQYMTTGKTIPLTRQTFVGKVMSLLHNFSTMEQASFNFMAALTICSDFGAPKIKSVTTSIVFPLICHEVMGPDAMIFSSVTQSCPTLCDPMNRTCQASMSITNSQNPLKLMSIEPMMPSNHLTLCHPLLLPPIPPSIRIFSNESTLHSRWPKYWSFSFSISSSNENPGLVSFRMDWLDLFAVQGTLKSLLQHHNSKAPILQHSAFFIVQPSHPHLTTGKTIALTSVLIISNPEQYSISQ